MQAADLTMIDSRVSGTSANDGGGIWSPGGALALTRCTIDTSEGSRGAGVMACSIDKCLAIGRNGDTPRVASHDGNRIEARDAESIAGSTARNVAGRKFVGSSRGQDDAVPTDFGGAMPGDGQATPRVPAKQRRRRPRLDTARCGGHEQRGDTSKIDTRRPGSARIATTLVIFRAIRLTRAWHNALRPLPTTCPQDCPRRLWTIDSGMRRAAFAQASSDCSLSDQSA